MNETRAGFSLILVRNARVCAQCQVVFDNRDACPMCASSLGVWSLSRWLNREPKIINTAAANP